MKHAPVILSCMLLIGSIASADPDFGPNVLIIDPSNKTAQSQIDSVFAKQERSQFGANRVAMLFKPGKYNLDVQVGFYTQVLGLGELSDDVAISGSVRSTARWMNGNATCNFWRSMENLSVTPTRDNSTVVWAVSQGVDVRRVHVVGNMNLWDNGWSSGGFLADSKIDGTVNSGSQQQWMSRNDDWNSWHGGSWNMVFVGTTNPPRGSWPQRPYTVIDQTPIIREKPYLFINNSGKYFVKVPDLAKNSSGTSWATGPTPGKSLPIEQFYIARADTDNSQSINDALVAGKNLLFTPGIYHLQSSLQIDRPDTVVLGIGFPTLVPDRGESAVEIADVDGMKIAGVLLEAGATKSENLLVVGPSGSSKSHAADPTFLFDVHARAGGASNGQAGCFVTINSNNVVGDNSWLWRADHGRGAGWNSNKNDNGLIVNGNDVTFYGLFVEHAQKFQTLWNGEGGRVYFYQSEMPYDPPSADAWQHDGVTGYASYKVADKVKTHEAWGLGVYCVLWNSPIIAENAIETPQAPGVKMHHMITLRLNGNNGSGINHILNGQGEAVITRQEARME